MSNLDLILIAVSTVILPVLSVYLYKYAPFLRIGDELIKEVLAFRAEESDGGKKITRKELNKLFQSIGEKVYNEIKK